MRLPAPTTGYAPVNGLRMYYEIHGTGQPLLLLHGAFMTINLLGDLLPELARTRQVIAVELQGHGRTADTGRALSYNAMADDVAALLGYLNLSQVDVFGFSMGGGVALQVAVRYPQVVGHLIVASASYRSAGLYPELFEGVKGMTPEVFTGTRWKAEYDRVAPRPEDFPILVDKLRTLDLQVHDWPAEEVRAILAPTLIVVGDADMIRPEHAVEMFRLRGGGVPGDLAGLPAARLAVLPGTTHLGVLDRAEWLAGIVGEFLEAPCPVVMP